MARARRELSAAVRASPARASIFPTEADGARASILPRRRGAGAAIRVHSRRLLAQRDLRLPRRRTARPRHRRRGRRAIRCAGLVRLSDIVGEIRQALSVLSRSRRRVRVRPRSAVRRRAGSAGGHLTAIVSRPPGLSRRPSHQRHLSNLEPIALNYLNEKLALDASEIATLSPLRVLGGPLTAVAIVRGAATNSRKPAAAIGELCASPRASALCRLRLLFCPHATTIRSSTTLARPGGAITRALVEWSKKARAIAGDRVRYGASEARFIRLRPRRGEAHAPLARSSHRASADRHDDQERPPTGARPCADAPIRP